MVSALRNNDNNTECVVISLYRRPLDTVFFLAPLRQDWFSLSSAIESCLIAWKAGYRNEGSLSSFFLLFLLSA